MKSFLLPCLWWIDRLFDEGRIQNLDLGPRGNVNGGFVIKKVAILLQSTADPNRKCLLYNADQFFIMICKEMQQAYGKKVHYYRQQTNFSHNHPLQLWQALLVCAILIQLKRTFLHLWLAGVATFLLLWMTELASGHINGSVGVKRGSDPSINNRLLFNLWFVGQSHFWLQKLCRQVFVRVSWKFSFSTSAPVARDIENVGIDYKTEFLIIWKWFHKTLASM